MVVFALTRWPGLMPVNFSAAYGLVFCAGVYLPRRLAWWLPLLTLALTDLGLNLYYALALGIDAFKLTQLMNYAVFAVILWLGTRFKPKAAALKLIAGGLFAAIVFYFLTNTASWFFNPFGNPEYTRTVAGWLHALTKGTQGYAQTWEFFRNTLLSGGIFTGLFVGAMKLTAAAESSREKEAPEAEDRDSTPVPEGTPEQVEA